MRREWTAERVIAGLIAEFRDVQGRAIYSPPLGGVVRAVAGDEVQWNFLTLTWVCLGRDRTSAERRARLYLLTYCACTATGASLAERCREAALGSSHVVARVARRSAQRVAETMAVAMEVADAVERLRLTQSKSAPQ